MPWGRSIDAEESAKHESAEILQQLSVAKNAVQEAIETAHEDGFQSSSVKQIEAASAAARIAMENEVRVLTTGAAQSNAAIRDKLNQVPVDFERKERICLWAAWQHGS
eukprot:s70_g45.t1